MTPEIKRTEPATPVWKQPDQLRARMTKELGRRQAQEILDNFETFVAEVQRPSDRAPRFYAFLTMADEADSWTDIFLQRTMTGVEDPAEEAARVERPQPERLVMHPDIDVSVYRWTNGGVYYEACRGEELPLMWAQSQRPAFVTATEFAIRNAIALRSA